MNLTKRPRQYALAIITLAIFVGCGGGASESGTPVTEVVIEPSVPQISPPLISSAKLKPASTATFSRLVKNGIFVNFDTDSGVVNPSAPTMAESAAQSDALTTDTESFSQTITQEEGVDEMDIMKFDGQYLYVVKRNVAITPSSDISNSPKAEKLPSTDALSPIWAPEPTKTQIRVLAKQADQSLLEQSTIDVMRNENSTYAYLRGLYLRDEQLVVLGEGYNSSGYLYNNGIWWGGESQFSVELFDMSDTQSPILHSQLTIDGYLISSKRIDNQLLLVSSYMPNLPSFSGLGTTDAERIAGYNAIQETEVDDLIPSISTITNENIVAVNEPLFTPQDCYIPENATELDSSRGMIIMTMVDLDDPSSRSVKCINGYYDDVYVTTDSVFVHGAIRDYDQNGNMTTQATVVHHFNQSAASSTMHYSYNGTTQLPGHLGWDKPNLRLSAHAEYLRVVTTQSMSDAEDRFDHVLHMVSLTAQNNQLNVMATLPNSNAPEELGKPNEDIRAVRYFGDTAYMVTFEQIDPLYVIDLSNPMMPVVTGELEMPGYSSYLHPINANFILGIGQNIPAGGFNLPPALSGADEVGAKVALFEVSSTPRIVDEYIFANGYSPAEFDYHALTYLPQSDTEFLFAMPMQSWTFTDDSWGEDNRLEIFQVDLSGNASMNNDLRVVTPNTENQYYGAWEDRAVVIGDVIYYVKGQQIWQTTLSNTAIVNGPY